ncbi:MAG: hypothetical protein IT438_16025 [Phycisphaerales bacterium]|nr:hypothetical protein [Phycisphaerales bacterium]
MIRTVLMCVLVSIVAYAVPISAMARAEGVHDTAADPAAPDPAVAGEWLVFCSIQAQAESQAGCRTVLREFVGIALTRMATWVYPPNAPEFDRIKELVDQAAKGKPVSVWLVPSSNNEPGPFTMVSHDDVVKSPHTAIVSAASSEWPAHRAMSAAAHPETPVTIELALNLNNARRLFPAAFDPAIAAGRGGGAARVLDALRLSNARTVGLHIRLIPPARVRTRDPSLPRIAGTSEPAYKGPTVALIEASWSARSQPPGTIYLAPLTTDHWPTMQVGDPAGDDGLAAVVRVPWRGALDSALGVYGGLLDARDVTRFDRQAVGWREAHESAIQRLTSTLDPWVQVGIRVGAPHELHATARLREDASAAATAAALDSFAETLPGGLRAAGRAPPWTWTADSGSGWWLGRVGWTLTERKAPERSTIEVAMPVRRE